VEVYVSTLDQKFEVLLQFAFKRFAGRGSVNHSAELIDSRAESRQIRVHAEAETIAIRNRVALDHPSEMVTTLLHLIPYTFGILCSGHVDSLRHRLPPRQRILPLAAARKNRRSANDFKQTVDAAQTEECLPTTE
jgi:hypothetical protein